MASPLEITENIDARHEIIRHTGPVRIGPSVEHLRLRAIIVTAGSLSFDGDAGSMQLDVVLLSVDDPRTQAGAPTDAFHLGGVTGHVKNLIGTGLQGDLAKMGQGTRDLMIDHAIGRAVAYEDPKPKHQDGIQIMDGHDITIRELTYQGGPSTNHAAFFCNPGLTADSDDPSLIHHCIVLGGTIITKATGIALGACTICGARNMHITAHYPFRKNEQTRQPVDENNTKAVYR